METLVEKDKKVPWEIVWFNCFNNHTKGAKMTCQKSFYWWKRDCNAFGSWSFSKCWGTLVQKVWGNIKKKKSDELESFFSNTF